MNWMWEMIKWMTTIFKTTMKTETQWTDRGPWAFYYIYIDYCQILVDFEGLRNSLFLEGEQLWYCNPCHIKDDLWDNVTCIFRSCTPSYCWLTMHSLEVRPSRAQSLKWWYVFEYWFMNQAAKLQITTVVSILAPWIYINLADLVTSKLFSQIIAFHF